MLSETNPKPKSRIQLVITGAAEEYAIQFQTELSERSKNVKMPGFRPGHAPKAKSLQALGSQALQAGALDRLISNLYYEAIQESKLVPVGQPEVDVTSFSPEAPKAEAGEVLRFTAEFDVLPEVDITGYEKIKLKTAEAEVASNEDVSKVTDYLRKQKANLEAVAKDMPVELGMWADLGYQGSVDGVSREDMKNEHHPLILGEGQLVPGFEEQLTGMKVGDLRTITVTFPTDYHAKELQAKDVVFDVTLHELKSVTLPELDDTFAESFGHKNATDLNEAIRTSLAEEKEQEVKKAREEEALAALVTLKKFDIPESLVDQEQGRLFTDARKRFDQIPGQWERYLEQTKKTVEEVQDDLRPQAEKNVRSGIALGKLVQLMGIKDSDRAGQQALDQMIDQLKSK